MKVRIAGRYFMEPVRSMFIRIHRAGKKASRPVESERSVKLIQNSIDRDLVEQCKKKAHGQDVLSLAEIEQEKQSAMISAQMDEQETEYLSEIIEVLRETLSQAELRLAEVSSKKGGTVYFLSRQRDFAQARARMQQKAGQG